MGRSTNNVVERSENKPSNRTRQRVKRGEEVCERWKVLKVMAAKRTADSLGGWEVRVRWEGRWRARTE